MEHKSSLATLCKLLLLPLLVVAGLAFSSSTVMASSYSYEKQRQCSDAELHSFRLVMGDGGKYGNDMSNYRCRRVYSTNRLKSGKVQACWWTQVRERRHFTNLFGSEWSTWGTIGGGRPRGCKTN